MISVNETKLENLDIVKDVYPRLSQRSSILFTLAKSLVEPEFDETIPTACVGFSKENEDKNVFFLFNPTFWESLSSNDKYFVFIHEILHVLLFHGSRGEKFLKTLQEDQRNDQLLNIAMDISINELILNQFTDLSLGAFPKIQETGCFVETCFEGEQKKLPKDKSFEFYYNELLKNPDISEAIKPIDLHSFLGSLSEEEMNDLEQMINEIIGMDSEEENQSDNSDSSREEKLREEFKSESNIGGSEDKIEDKVDSIDVSKLSTEKKLEYYLNDFIASKFGGKEPKPKVHHNWYKQNRRSIGISSKNITIPNRIEEIKKKGKNKIVVYCDVSGSVSSYASMMMKLVSELSEDRYEKDIYVWASQVKEAVFNKNSKRWKYHYAGHGTAFSKVKSHYKFNYKEKNKPDAVIVLTDGYFNESGYGKTNTEDLFKNWTFFMINKNTNCPSKSTCVNLNL